ncbi:MAG: AarF/ABC1/UbiB kinase family protein [Alphaproteobacteria bacterium]|nr:AarF/ABC1/UbiB kinase family protein [Alphaproteobacteria bacterium]
MPIRDSNTLRKRAVRYAKVSKAVAGAGARLAGEKVLGIKKTRRERAVLLGKSLGGLKGPVMKVAQLLAAIPDIIPKEYADELAHLQADAPPMGWPFVKRRMTAELGPDWQKKFKSFEPEAAHAASLGQVHRAVGLDGRKLACKLQYPDMSSVVEADLKQLQLVLAIFERFDRTISTKQIQAEIAARMREELDYVREAKHIRLYRYMFGAQPEKETPSPAKSKPLLRNDKILHPLPQVERDLKDAHVPEVVDKLSTDRLLTMTWLEGERLADAADKRPLNDRNAIAINMFRAWYAPFYYYGIIHGDPHLGNYIVRPDNSINLLDFGCVRIFRPELVKGVIQLYHALRDGERDLAVEAYKAWGFSNPNKELIDALNIWAQFIYAPILEDKARLIEETNSGLYGRETAFRVHRELRKIGGVNIPREFVFIDRASLGLGSVFLRLRAKVNWHRLFNDLVSDFDARMMASRQHKALRAIGLSADSSS